MNGFATYQLPTMDNLAHSLLVEQINNLAEEFGENGKPLLASWPLSAITFEDIWKVRMGKGEAKYRDNLDDVYNAMQDSDTSKYKAAMHRHMHFIADVTSWSFSEPSPQELAAALPAAVYAGEPTAAGTLTIAKYAVALFRDFIPNCRKELQLRWFFRTMRQQLDQAPS